MTQARGGKPKDGEAAEVEESVASPDSDVVEDADRPAEGGGEVDEDPGAVEPVGAVEADGAQTAEDLDPLAAAESARDEYLELAQRAQADFENYRRRIAKDIAAAGARAKGSLVRELLPVVDNLERALAAADDSSDGLHEGVKLVHGGLIAALERSGVEGFAPVGEPFDPALHEALSTRAQADADSGLVVEVVEKGYRIDKTVLRPARVVVAE